MPTFKQTNKLKPTEEQFKELFDLRINTFWKYGAYSWADPKTIWKSPEEMRDNVWLKLKDSTLIWQMYWEDDVLLGFRSFERCTTMNIGSAPVNKEYSPFNKMFGEDTGWELRTLRCNIALSRPSPSMGNMGWMYEPFVAPTWDNNDGESLYQAMIDFAFDRAYAPTYGSLQKQLIWNNRDSESIKHDIFLQAGFKYNNEISPAGFDINDDETHIYRLIGGDSMGWPRFHALYHQNNASRPEVVPRPYMETLDSPDKPPVAPIPPGTE